MLIPPTVEFPPVTPPTRQITALFVVPVTLGVNVSMAPVVTFATVGVMETCTRERTVTTAEPEAVASATLVAVTVTVAGEGATAGAV